MNILILGSNGMLGNALMRFFSDQSNLQVTGVMRSSNVFKFNERRGLNKLIVVPDLLSYETLKTLIGAKPDVVINCIGAIKYAGSNSSDEGYLDTNGLLPHKLELICTINGVRLIQFSTDCVFSGSKGLYTEDDQPDATDIYGLSKRVGEIISSKNVVTIRTSIIGHEVLSKKSLLEWFLSQTENVFGYKNAIFSGFPACEIAQILYRFILFNESIYGLYHISSEPISKYELLLLISKRYSKNILIIPSENLIINRSLNSDKFRRITGFYPKSWNEMIKEMSDFS